MVYGIPFLSLTSSPFHSLKFSTVCLKLLKDSKQTQILHCIWAESLSNYHIDLLTENFQSTLDRTDIGKMHLTIISAERQRAVTQETLKNYVNGIHLLEDFYRGVKIDMSHSLGDTFDHFIDLSPEYKWMQSSCHCKMLTVQEEILLKNYDTNFIQTFNPIDLIGLSDTLSLKLSELNESKSGKFALSACYQNSKTLFNSREIS